MNNTWIFCFLGFVFLYISGGIVILGYGVHHGWQRHRLHSLFLVYVYIKQRIRFKQIYFIEI